MDSTTQRINLIRKRLTQAFNPSYLNIQDDSAQHKNHPEAQKQPGGHFTIEIIATAFSDKAQLERHRMIYVALGDAMGRLIHAISINAKTPAEAHKEKSSEASSV